jgi:N-acetylglucosamine-6-sulfatase
MGRVVGSTAKINFRQPTSGKLFGKLLVLVALPLCLVSACSRPPAEPREAIPPHLLHNVAPSTTPVSGAPNILFILTDDQRADDMGCYGNGVVRTPSFDRVAAEGARLGAFYVTSPLCCPSRASLLTGLYPHQRDNGVIDNHHPRDIPAGVPTVATRLHALGYVTGFVGKAHLGGDPRRWGFDDCPVWLPEGSSRHENPSLMFDGRRKTARGTITSVFTDAATHFVERHQRQPWFLWFATTAPHPPYYRDPSHPYSNRAILASAPPPLWPPGEPPSRYDWAGYYSTTSTLDDQVGRLLRRLDELGLADNTLVVVMGDNGVMHGSHGLRGKGVWFEEAVRVPALVRWPGHVKAGSVVSPPTSEIDLLPTLLDAAGGAAEADLPGKSLLPTLNGATPARDEVFSEARKSSPPWAGQHWQMVRSGGWKYVHFPGGSEALYDLDNDSGETAAVAAPHDPRAISALHDLRQRLGRWLSATP